jgi:Tfp pilus assembly protein PilN
VERSQLAARTSLLEQSGFRISGITADVSTLGAAFRDEEEALLMNTGERHTLFALYRFGVPVLLRKLPLGVQTLLDEKGRVTQGGSQQFTAEIKRTIHSFNARVGLDLDRLYATGNLILFDELRETLREQVRAEIVLRPADAFEVLVEADAESQAANVFAALMGAAHWRRRDGSFHFLKEEFVQQDAHLSGPRLLRWGSGLVIAFVLMVLLSYGLNLMVLRERRDFLRSEIRETFTSAFPQVNRIVDELKQANNLLESMESSGLGSNPQGGPSLLTAFRGISAAIPPDVAFEIVSLFWETGKIEINGRTDSFRTVNAIQELLTASEEISQVSISNARFREEGQDVEFKLSIRFSG